MHFLLYSSLIFPSICTLPRCTKVQLTRMWCTGKLCTGAQVIPLKKTDSPIPSSHQLPIIFGQGWSLMRTSPICAEMMIHLILDRSCLHSYSHFELVDAMTLSCQEDTISLQFFSSSSYDSFCAPLSAMSLRLWGRPVIQG